jgi:ribosomal protein S12 methylthiotransferase accessory factor YcaO
MDIKAVAEAEDLRNIIRRGFLMQSAGMAAGMVLEGASLCGFYR